MAESKKTPEEAAKAAEAEKRKAAEAEKRKAAELQPAVQTGTPPGALAPQEPSALVGVGSAAMGNPWQDKQAFNQLLRVANMLSQSVIVPQNYQNRPQDCFIAVELAARMNTSPIFIMQNLYVVKGKPSWAGQACIAIINTCGKFANARHVYTGERGTPQRGCYVVATRLSDGAEVMGTEITMAMVHAEGWDSNSKWRSMPEQMLGYRAASFFAKMHCPEALMGIQTQEEVIDAEPRSNVSDLTEALKPGAKEG